MLNPPFFPLLEVPSVFSTSRGLSHVQPSVFSTSRGLSPVKPMLSPPFFRLVKTRWFFLRDFARAPRSEVHRPGLALPLRAERVGPGLWRWAAAGGEVKGRSVAEGLIVDMNIND
jgi:hypothetical protein